MIVSRFNQRIEQIGDECMPAHIVSFFSYKPTEDTLQVDMQVPLNYTDILSEIQNDTALNVLQEIPRYIKYLGQLYNTLQKFGLVTCWVDLKHFYHEKDKASCLDIHLKGNEHNLEDALETLFSSVSFPHIIIAMNKNHKAYELIQKIVEKYNCPIIDRKLYPAL